MKPRKPLPRRKAFIERSKKRIPRLNVKRARRQADKYALYLRSPEWKEKKRLVRERSGGRCENFVQIGIGERRFSTRCNRPAKVCQHLTYARFGHELLTDLRDDCESCDREYEGARPWRAARRAALSRAEKAAS